MPAHSHAAGLGDDKDDHEDDAIPTPVADLSPNDARRALQTRSVLVIDDPPLPTASTFGVDSVEFVTNDRFRGIKLLPPGWHLFVWSASTHQPTHDESDAHLNTTPPVGPLRSALLHYFPSDQRDVLVRKWLMSTDEVLPFGHDHVGVAPRRLLRHWPSEPTAAAPPRTIYDEAKLRSLDPLLGAWPLDHSLAARWHRATYHMRRRPDSVARVVGLDADSGDGCLDGASEAPHLPGSERALGTERMTKAERALEESLKRGATRTTWGRDRTMQLDVPHDDDDHDDSRVTDTGSGSASRGAAQGDEERQQQEEQQQQERRQAAERKRRALHFTAVDLRKSWPEGATGEELTRWSLDKSVALQRALDEAGGASALLAEMELAFLAFVYVHNATCLSVWQTIVSLFCRSLAFLGARGGAFAPHPAETHDVEGNGLGDVVSGADGREGRASFGVGAGRAGAGAGGAARGPKTSCHAAFLRTLRAQLALARADLLRDELPDVASWLVGELGALRSGMARALAASASRHNARRRRPSSRRGDSPSSSRGRADEVGRGGVSLVDVGGGDGDDEDAALDYAWAEAKSGAGAGDANGKGPSAATENLKNQGGEDDDDDDDGAESGAGEADFGALLGAWRSLSHTLRERLDVRLDERLDEEVEVAEDEAAEQGEDAPVVVEL